MSDTIDVPFCQIHAFAHPCPRCSTTVQPSGDIVTPDPWQYDPPRVESRVSVPIELKLRVMVGDIVAVFATFTPHERVTALEQLREVYCFGCGGEQPKVGRRCQCQNDE